MLTRDGRKKERKEEGRAVYRKRQERKGDRKKGREGEGQRGGESTGR